SPSRPRRNSLRAKRSWSTSGCGIGPLWRRYPTRSTALLSPAALTGSTPGLEPEAGVAKHLALAEGVAAARHQLEQVRLVAAGPGEGATAHGEAPVVAEAGAVGVLAGHRAGHTPQRRLVTHPHRLALDHHVEPVDHVAAGQQRAARVAGQVARLLLGRPGEEVEHAVDDGPEQRRHVRAALRPHRHDPVDVRLLEAAQGLEPARRRV